MDKQTYKTIHPANGELKAEFELAEPGAIEQTLALCHRTHQSWKLRSFEERASALNAVAKLLEDRTNEAAHLITLEMGKPTSEAKVEVQRCIDVCRFYAVNGEGFLRSETRQASDGLAELHYEPLGIVFIIMPWNFPFWQTFRCAAPALMAGNTVLLKHAPSVPQCALFTARLFNDVSAGLLETLFLDDKQAASVIHDPRVRAVSLTGSVRAGKAVARIAGEALKPCVLELGGSDPFIVCADADLALAVEAGTKMRYFNCGQSCISPKRFFVEHSVYKTFLEQFLSLARAKVVGDPFAAETTVGPMARKDLRDEVSRQVKQSITEGAKCLLGGDAAERAGFFFSPTVLTEFSPGNVALREEVFGPVAAIVPFKNEAELLAQGNATEFGLGASVWSADSERAQRLARGLEVGNVYLNSFVRSDQALPFGGAKHSGLGRELGLEGARSFTNLKTVWRKS